MAAASRIYRIHRQRLSKNHKYEIDNNTDEILYTVHSTSSLLFGTLSFCETSTGKELIKICEESHHLHISYSISAVRTNDSNDQDLATVKRTHDHDHSGNILVVTSIFGLYKVEHIDDSTGHEFKVTTGNKTVIDVIQNFKCPNLSNMYHVEISDDDGGDVFLLALVIAIWCAQRHHYI